MEELAVEQRRIAIGGRAEPAFGLLDQIVDDRAGLGDHPPFILDHRRLAERMDRFSAGGASIVLGSRS